MRRDRARDGAVNETARGTVAGVALNRPLKFKRPEPTFSHRSKPRFCLRCRHAFESSWSGERVCTPCKTSAAWRQSTDLIAR